jgi:DNA processing protein
MQLTPVTTNAIRIDRKSADYPRRLHDLYDLPDSLYIYGDAGLLKKPMIAIVGSRNASPEGLKNVRHIAQGLAKARGRSLFLGDGNGHR